jgi:hypothetical protein
MMIDDFSKPLGRDRSRTRQSTPPLSLSRSVTVLLGLGTLLLAGWIWRADDRTGNLIGGEPIGIATIPMVDDGTAAPVAVIRPALAKPGRQVRADNTARDTAQDAAHDTAQVMDLKLTASGRTAPARAAADPATRTITIIDGVSGQRQEMTIPVAGQP